MADAYGIDTYCGAGGLQTGRLASGPLSLGLWAFRALSTPQGTLQGLDDQDEEASFGYDLAGHVGRTDSRDVRASFGPAIRAVLMQDDRVRDVATTVASETASNGLTTYTLAIRILPVGADATLTLTLDVSSVTVDLLGIST